MKRKIEDLSEEQKDRLGKILQKQEEIQRELVGFMLDHELDESIMNNASVIFQDIAEHSTFHTTNINFLEDNSLHNITDPNDLSFKLENDEESISEKLMTVLSEYRKLYYHLSIDQQEKIYQDIPKEKDPIKYINTAMHNPAFSSSIKRLSSKDRQKFVQEVHKVRVIETRSKLPLSKEAKIARREYFKLPLQLKTVPPTFIDKNGKQFLIETYFDTGNEKYKAQRADLKTGKKQMRHVIPVAFTAKIANSIAQIEDSKAKSNSLAQALEIFGVFDQPGYMMTYQEYTYISASLNITNSLRNQLTALALQAQQMDTDIFIPQKLFEKINHERKIVINLDEQHQRFKSYKKIAEDYTVGNIYEILQNNINPYILENILIGALATSFSQHIDVSFPIEGHTMEYEIKIEDNGKDTVISLKELEDIISKKSAELSKVRIVKSEGANVRAAIRNIHESAQKLIDLDNSNEKQGKIKKDSRDDKKIDRVIEQITYQMYKVFDYKRLEDKILVPVENKIQEKNVIKINNEYYQIISGKEYRENQRISAKPGYSDNIRFREEETSGNREEQIKQLTDLVNKHIEVVLLAFPTTHLNQEIEKKIVESFVSRVEKDYQITGEILNVIKMKRRDTTYDSEYEDSYDKSLEKEQSITDDQDSKLQEMSLDKKDKQALKNIQNDIGIITESYDLTSVVISSPPQKKSKQLGK